MAMMEPEMDAQSNPGVDIQPIDPHEEPEIATIYPKWPEQHLLASAEFVASFDRRSDTFVLYFSGWGREAVGVESGTHVYALVDPSTEEIIGFQLDNFLAHSVKQCPAAIELLEHAELRGITVAEVRALRREVLGLRQRITERIRHPDTAPVPQKRRLLKLFERNGASFDGLACI